MRAKELAKRFVDNPTDDELAKIATEIYTETVAITKQRNVTTDIGLIPIVFEQDRKWRAFAREVDAILKEPTINPDGFQLLVCERTPEFTPIFARRTHA